MKTQVYHMKVNITTGTREYFKPHDWDKTCEGCKI